jgi:hypothetical protein
MIHGGILQPKIVIGQQLIVVSFRRTLTTMSCENEKIEFAKRMDDACDLLDIPPKGKNRQESLGKMFEVSQEAARKWLSGESIPKLAQCIEIATRAKVNFEWLMTGRGPMMFAESVANEGGKMTEAARYLSLTNEKKYQVDALIDAMNKAPGNEDNPIYEGGKRPITN